MTGIQYIAPVAFTGTNASTLPLVLTDLPVANPLRRFVADAIQQQIGTTVSAWADSAGSGTTIVPTSSTAPTLSTVDSKRAVLFNGTSDGLQQSISMTNPNTLVLVAKIVTPNTTTNNTLSGSYVTSGADSARLEAAINDIYVNAGTGLKVGAGLNVSGWRVYVVSFNGASTVVNINGTEYTGDAGVLPRAVFTLGFARGGNFSNIAVTEAALYNGAMSSADRTSTVNALRNKYGI